VTMEGKENGDVRPEKTQDGPSGRRRNCKGYGAEEGSEDDVVKACEERDMGEEYSITYNVYAKCYVIY